MLNSKSDFVSMNDPAGPVRIILSSFVVDPKDISQLSKIQVNRSNRPQRITAFFYRVAKRGYGNIQKIVIGHKQQNQTGAYSEEFHYRFSVIR